VSIGYIYPRIAVDPTCLVHVGFHADLAGEIHHATAPASCGSGGNLRRNDDLGGLNPLTLALATVFTRLRTAPPYASLPASGSEDPEGGVLADKTRPLVVYELVDPTPVMVLTRSAADTSWCTGVEPGPGPTRV